jgi:hypothetical protein
MNLSAWDSIKPRKKNPSLSSGHIILEFDRTKKSKIFAHKLGNITFSGRDINSPRDEIIFVHKENLNLDGFVYKNVGHTYSNSEIISEDPDLGGFPIYAHGHPLGGVEHGGMESCVRAGLICKDGEGEDTLCNPGKCIIGKLSYVRNKKWKYESSITYNSNSPLIYYLNGEKEISLHSVLRGKAITFTEDGPLTLNITSPASKYSKIFLPPKYYFSEDFIDQGIKVIDERLNNIGDPPKTNVIGIESRKNRFISSFITLLYPGRSNEAISLILYEDGVRDEVRDELLSIFSALPDEWYEQCKFIIEEEYLYREAYIYDNYKFISAVYDRIKELFSSILQITNSSLKRGNLNYSKESISRPVYSRLPGISEAYRSDPRFSEKESPAQWLTSGIDEFLSAKKDQVSAFYQNYLDLETCSPLVLDWLAQHVGLFGDLWDDRWEREIKVAMIENAFGWYDREKTFNLPGIGSIKTPKGEALNKFPFTTNSLWTSDSTLDNSNKIKLDEINSLIFDNNLLSEKSVYKEKSFDNESKTLSLLPTNSIKIYDGKWNGLMEAKGSILSFAFLSSIFNLKSHTEKEIEITNTVTLKKKGVGSFGVIVRKPKNGLRNAEIDAPPIWPYKSEILQVGGEVDLKINNYSNQIVAGVSRVTSVEDSKNVFFRVPYFYNRDGKSWDRLNYISKNWLPDNLNKRVQYAYLSADLWAVGDGFFEPEISDESIYKSGLIKTEDDQFYLITESGVPLNHGVPQEIVEIDESIYETPLILTEQNQFVVTETQAPLNYST